MNGSITLDLNGSTLNGTGLTTFNGIEISGKDNITIKNGTIKGFSDAIRFAGSNTNITLRNLTIQNPTETAIYFYGSSVTM